VLELSKLVIGTQPMSRQDIVEKCYGAAFLVDFENDGEGNRLSLAANFDSCNKAN